MDPVPPKADRAGQARRDICTCDGLAAAGRQPPIGSFPGRSSTGPIPRPSARRLVNSRRHASARRAAPPPTSLPSANAARFSPCRSPRLPPRRAPTRSVPRPSSRPHGPALSSGCTDSAAFAGHPSTVPAPAKRSRSAGPGPGVGQIIRVPGAKPRINGRSPRACVEGGGQPHNRPHRAQCPTPGPAGGPVAVPKRLEPEDAARPARADLGPGGALRARPSKVGAVRASPLAESTSGPDRSISTARCRRPIFVVGHSAPTPSRTKSRSLLRLVRPCGRRGCLAGPVAKLARPQGNSRRPRQARAPARNGIPCRAYARAAAGGGGASNSNSVDRNLGPAPSCFGISCWPRGAFSPLPRTGTPLQHRT